ncbi:membrane peptidoglycan carboxypeptidase [Amycolatopsis bartoniae]|uniref:Penicillin-binding protein n=1 Tax=Amycolatopsis bartoniae TaxID=941986 RepID=A0A8H9J0S6_9PSEU|nr:transglycosylase domain-containing protein [Amycolatopsis bartoniae]MBB2935211.1 membrane peptidoglycan carboxypeptidase [Amycolatopsis bartoniae]TVT04078.1 penicillin-binding protein [Amycolatopsis bartoniae]GHF75120.1 penicillin-binding protein [Amycolatopsis bartoniae]
MRKTDGLFKLLGLCLLAGILVAGVLFPIVGAAGVASNKASETVDSMSAELANVPPPLVTTITDSAGNPIATLYDQYRIPTASSQINDAMKWALVSVEDKRFYEHHGVDWKGTIRAALSNSTGGDTQGASTLTQQYVKNYLINVIYRDDEVGQKKAQEQSVARKLKEARIAIQLESKMDKQQILTSYLNVVEFSRKIYGVGAAAQAYFGTTAEKLSVPQAALLAGMVNNPPFYDPWKYPERATERRNLVLDRMVENQKLAPEDAARFKTEPLGVVPDGPARPASNCTGAGPENGFFCQYVQDYLLTNGMSKDDLYTGGYTIRTTMDQNANHQAKVSAETQVSKTQKNVANTLSLVRPGKNRHEVVALAANRDYGTDADKGQTTYALPSDVSNVTGAGSSYKIFTAASALEQHKTGIYATIQTPQTYASKVFTGSPAPCPFVAPYTRGYCLSNYGEANYGSSMSLQQALATSPNTGFVILEEQVGVGKIIDMARRLGMRNTMASNAANGGPVDPKSDNAAARVDQAKYYGPTDKSAGFGSFTLGISPTSGLELANVAATIMSDGVWCPPTPIAAVTDREGKPVQVKEAACEQAVPEELAHTLAVGMSKDDTDGTSRGAAQQVGWNRPMMGKTGTTQESGSATFVGAVPQMAGAAMVFRPDTPFGGLRYSGPGKVAAVPSSQGNMFGGMTPAYTWFNAMTQILGNQPAPPLPPSDPAYEH